MSPIQQFYAGQSIFVTGGTGFMGKVLIEKLLRSCPDIDTVYLLIRDKKGKSVQDRVDALFIDPVFEVLRSEYPDFPKKVVGLNGDISVEGLGLSTADYDRLISEVSSIFHVAATVRFNEKLDRAVAVNVNSVKSVIDIAKACKNLKVAIYVSTAYSNCARRSVDEEFYPPPFSYERINEIVEDIGKQKMSKDEMNNFTAKLIGEWPNTYSFTKAIAEGVVAAFANDLPFAVFRPSIVMPAYKEPIPGWLDVPTGLSELMYAIGLGVMHVGLIDKNIRGDVVPVDYACNALITCAWDTAVAETAHRQHIPVYNYVSGNENPITWNQVLRDGLLMGSLYPINSAVYYNTFVPTTSRFLFPILTFFLHFVPAFVIDGVSRLMGKPSRMYEMARKIEIASYTLAYFGLNQWDFANDRVQSLWKRIGPQDRTTFPFSMRNVDWDEHAMKMAKGFRRFIASDPDSNLERARLRHFCLYIIHVILCLTLNIFILWIIWKSFCVCS